MILQKSIATKPEFIPTPKKIQSNCEIKLLLRSKKLPLENEFPIKFNLSRFNQPPKSFSTRFY
ncbi:hypothetical protein P872_23735 [Rhodonellum psychrophilum GCM71 = DSM 17998]|uniref:Uncharacterized protein n=1 Tax=Rhodonellum psychrophilum GCM71 = DSM 17998 TaxID=1123057 RepID=U5BVQ1_9BACT|nr:hypothetical protein P872_23735 [Rhodonellum psychrophilum GCM71 = DSM 17998]